MWPFRKRLLFKYHNGEKTVKVDPLPLIREIVKENEQLQALATAYQEQKEPEASEFIDKICKIFKLKRFDPKTATGLTEAEILQIFAKFSQFIEKEIGGFFTG